MRVSRGRHSIKENLYGQFRQNLPIGTGKNCRSAAGYYLNIWLLDTRIPANENIFHVCAVFCRNAASGLTLRTATSTLRSILPCLTAKILAHTQKMFSFAGITLNAEMAWKRERREPWERRRDMEAPACHGNAGVLAGEHSTVKYKAS